MFAVALFRLKLYVRRLGRRVGSWAMSAFHLALASAAHAFGIEYAAHPKNRQWERQTFKDISPKKFQSVLMLSQKYWGDWAVENKIIANRALNTREIEELGITIEPNVNSNLNPNSHPFTQLPAHPEAFLRVIQAKRNTGTVLELNFLFPKGSKLTHGLFNNTLKEVKNQIDFLKRYEDERLAEARQNQSEQNLTHTPPATLVVYFDQPLTHTQRGQILAACQNRCNIEIIDVDDFLRVIWAMPKDTQKHLLASTL
jgi:hypothetical protein